MIWALALLSTVVAILAVAVVRLRADVTKLLRAVAVHERDLTATKDARLLGGER